MNKHIKEAEDSLEKSRYNAGLDVGPRISYGLASIAASLLYLAKSIEERRKASTGLNALLDDLIKDQS